LYFSATTLASVRYEGGKRHKKTIAYQIIEGAANSAFLRFRNFQNLDHPLYMLLKWRCNLALIENHLQNVWDYDVRIAVEQV
jgi:hypothetical protein